MENKVKCCNCEWEGIEDDLIPFKEGKMFGDGYGGFGRPECLTDKYLAEVEE